MKGGPLRALLAVLLVAPTLGLTGACGSSRASGAGDDRPRYLSREEAEKEYFDEAAKWTLPPGWSWPKSPVFSGKGPNGGTAAYETNLARTRASYYWFCAWSRTLLGAKSATDRDSALQQVLRLPETPFYQVGLQTDVKGSFDKKLQAAKAGDLSALTTSTNANCPTESK